MRSIIPLVGGTPAIIMTSSVCRLILSGAPVKRPAKRRGHESYHWHGVFSATYHRLPPAHGRREISVLTAS